MAVTFEICRPHGTLHVGLLVPCIFMLLDEIPPVLQQTLLLQPQVHFMPNLYTPWAVLLAHVVRQAGAGVQHAGNHSEEDNLLEVSENVKRHCCLRCNIVVFVQYEFLQIFF